LRALAAPALVGLDANRNGLRFPSLPQQLDFLINKPDKMLNRVENRFKLELNSGLLSSVGLFSENSD
jgi:hypothetical protein